MVYIIIFNNKSMVSERKQLVIYSMKIFKILGLEFQDFYSKISTKNFSFFFYMFDEGIFKAQVI